MKYRPEIDGLRTVAVLPVVAYHAGMHNIPGGFAGVDVFFVISGFLITGIIAEEAEQGRFSIARFYERRARRILPALFFVILATIIASWSLLVPYQLEDLAQSVLATLLFLSNILFWFESGYFAVEAASKPLLHTWSLAVEEQFYIVFPLLLVLLYRVGRQTILPVLLLAALASFAAACIYSRTSPSASFFLIQFRAWELLAGALGALLMRNRPPAGNSWVAAGGLVAVVLSFFVVTESSIWPGPLTLLPVLGTTALLVFSRGDTGVGRLLASAPMRFVGLISYSLYLWHLPPLVLLNIQYYGDSPVWARVAAVVFAFFMAWISWWFIERPFRVVGGIHIGRFSTIAAGVMALLVTFGVIGIRTTGFQSYMLAQVPKEFAHKVIDRTEEVAARRLAWEPVIAEAAKPFSDTGNVRRILILGDSLSADLMMATGGRADKFPGSEFRRIRLDDRCMPRMIQALGEARSPSENESEKCARETRAVLTSGLIEEADEIVLAANWQPETAEDGITLARLLKEQKGITVDLLGVAAFNDMASLSMGLYRVTEPVDRFMYRNIRSKFLPVNARFKEVAAEDPDLRYLDKLGLYCNETERSCVLLDDVGKPIIFDSAHVTARGLDIMTNQIVSQGWFE